METAGFFQMRLSTIFSCEGGGAHDRSPELTSAGIHAEVARLLFAYINIGPPSPPETANPQISDLTSRASSYRPLWFINTSIMVDPSRAIRHVFKARCRVRFQSMLAWAHAYTYMHTRAGTGTVSDAFFKTGNMIMNLA